MTQRGRPRTDPAQRLWARTIKTARCWEWQGPPNSSGYGYLSVDGVTIAVHVFSYELAFGPVPDGLEIDHQCNNPLCVNPAHLIAVTHRINVLRSDSPSAHLARRSRCDHGHMFTPDNIYWRTRPNGVRHRVCRQCAIDKANARHERIRQEKVALSGDRP